MKYFSCNYENINTHSREIVSDDESGNTSFEIFRDEFELSTG